MNSYEEKVAARKARLEEAAASARVEAHMTYRRAKNMASAIPFGQPILVDHYSARGDRNYRARIHNTFGKAFALNDRADELARRAATVGTAGISSDDPAAIAKLQTELSQRQAQQDRMKKANKLVRANNRDGLVAMGYAPKEIEALFKPDFCGRIGYPDYALTNNNANIRRIKQRIEQLERMTARAPVEQAREGYEYRENKEDNRVWFVFPAKPSEAVRVLLKRNAFKYSPSRCENGNSVYVRQMTPNAIGAARYMRPELEKLLND